MRNTFGVAIWVCVIGAGALMGACSDDGGGSSDTNGGEAAGGEPGSSAGSSGKAGSSHAEAGAGGVGHAGDASGGGAGQAGDASGGASAGVGAGGAPDAPGGAGGTGAEGGASNPSLEYACTANTINHTLCSAYSAAACPEDFDCATCVTDRKGERELFNDCATCLAVFDKYFQCGIDAYEAGNLATGVECVPGYGPDMTEGCYEFFFSAMDCSEWTVENPCPETWPLE